MLKMAYGYTIDSQKPDLLISMIERTLANFSRAAVPMGWAVDILPALRYLPDNFPGAKFKESARRWRKTLETSAYIPYRFVQRQVAADDHRPSYVSKMIEQLKHDGDGKLSPEDEQTIIWTAASLYGAAADTTVITLSAFALAMLQFPQVQRKAQQEIDAVIGLNRLPTFSDREKLPYINAIVKEATRWWPVIPMGFPHKATESFHHEGLHVPKGAYLLPAVWWFLHDPAVYSDPERFDPERFLPPRSEPDPESEAFGYGRRKCPGRFFADAGIYLNIAQTLAAFHIGKAVDKHGKEIEVNVKPGPGILTHLATFDIRVKPRSARHVELIRQLEKQSSPEDSDVGLLDGLSDWEDLA
jgi:cytochrome P450